MYIFDVGEISKTVYIQSFIYIYMYVRVFIMNKWKIKDSISVNFLLMSELSNH